MAETLAQMLDRLARTHFDGKTTHLAAAIGVTPSRFSRLMRQGEYSLSAENCLRVSRVTGEDPDQVLRAAGKGDVADLIHELYGKADASAEEKQLLRTWRSLPEDRRKVLLTGVIEPLAAAGKRAKTA